METIKKDSLVIENFTRKLNDYAETQSQLGEQPRALLISQAAQVIQLLANHCMAYDIGIPAGHISHVVNVR
jgi:hypothetical protein